MIEGDDGVGKETISAALAELYRNSEGALSNVGVSRVSFPMYDEPSGELIKNILTGDFGNPIDINPYLMSAIFNLDRKECYNRYLSNVLESGSNSKRIIFDRGWMSNLFYQGAKVFYSDIIKDIKAIMDAYPYLGTHGTLDDTYRSMDNNNGFFIIRMLPRKAFGLAIVKGNSCSKLSGGKTTALDTIEYKITEKRIETINNFIKWLYKSEVSDTFLNDANCHYFYIHSKSDLSSRKDNDEHEKNYWYRDLVKMFVEEIRLGLCDVPKCMHLHMKHIDKDKYDDVENRIELEVNRIANEIKTTVEESNSGN